MSDKKYWIIVIIGLVWAVTDIILIRPQLEPKPELKSGNAGIVEGPNLYPTVDLATVADGKWDRPRARVVGTVGEIRKEADGDWHMRLEDGGKFIVCEVIPEMPMSLPKVGERVAVYGIIREDKHHGWWEIHPVTKWGKP